MSAPTTNPYRLLPAVEDVLGSPELRELEGPELEGKVRRELLAAFVADVLARWRAAIQAGELDADGVKERLERGDLVRSVRGRVEREQKGGLVRVVNAAGVVLHTGLGRAPIHPEAARRMEEAARSYGTLEVDRFSGRRNQRDARLGELLARLTGAEDGIVVNNNAAAVLLTLSTFAAGRETVISRGELVEIGGSFRMPDVMVRANTKMVEAGTTNRTRLEDFRQAAGPDTGLLIKVHTSNYRVVGFTEEIDAPELARLGQELGIVSAYDLGSGLLDGPGAAPLDMLGETLVRDSVASGVDVVTFSGDKLLGGPQAGLLVGKREPVARLRKNPMYRALRLDKVTIAGLEATLKLYLDGRADEIPARAMMLKTPDALRPVAQRIADEIGRLAGFSAEVVDDASQPGSGSAPTVFLPSPVVRLTCTRWSAEELSSRLRAGEPSVFARIHEDRVMLDPRALLEGDLERLLTAFQNLA